MNIFLNFTPNKLVTFDDRDPLWMNDYVKGKIKLKNSLYKIYPYDVSHKQEKFELSHSKGVVKTAA